MYIGLKSAAKIYIIVQMFKIPKKLKREMQKLQEKWITHFLNLRYKFHATDIVVNDDSYFKVDDVVKVIRTDGEVIDSTLAYYTISICTAYGEMVGKTKDIGMDEAVAFFEKHYPEWETLKAYKKYICQKDSHTKKASTINYSLRNGTNCIDTDMANIPDFTVKKLKRTQ